MQSGHDRNSTGPGAYGSLVDTTYMRQSNGQSNSGTRRSSTLPRFQLSAWLRTWFNRTH